MDFYGRQEQARRASRWLVGAFALAVTLVVLAVNSVVLFTVAIWTSDGAVLMTIGDWLDTHPAIVWTTSLLVIGTILGPSLWKIRALQAGGKVVAADLGARLVTGEVTDPSERRLLNVVEEMAIASSVPVPAVHVLESPGINALAAGYAPAEATIVVTRGALQALDRAELQGVVGHEFSHILSGDMRLNTQLVGFLTGLFIVSELGRLLGPGTTRWSGRRRGALLGVAGMALFVIGLFGLFMGRLLQAAVARQRERLADASAVQFTRESRGLRNAMVKVGAHRVGSRLALYGVDRVSHMLFASAGRLDFATHPPLLERIRALDPGFESAEFGRMRRVLDARESAAVDRGERPPRDPDRLSGLFAADLPANAAAIAGLVGNPGPAQMRLAKGLRRAMPENVRAAAAEPRSAQGLLLAIAIGAGESAERLTFVRAQLGDAVAEEVRRLLPVAAGLPHIQRLPAVLLLMKALRQLDAVERGRLISVINGLITRGGAPTVFEYALRKSAMTYLQDGLRQPGNRWPLSVRNVRDDLRLVLGIVAKSGARSDPGRMHAAFDAGWARLRLPAASPVPAAIAWVGAMDKALDRLDRLANRDKEQVVQALTATIAHDGVINVAEAELLRLLCALLHCPLPPLLAEI